MGRGDDCRARDKAGERSRQGLVHSAPLAAFRPPGGGGGWRDEGGSEEGLETSCVAVCLLSPSFSPFFLPNFFHHSHRPVSVVSRLLSTILLQFNFSLKISLPSPHLLLSPISTSLPPCLPPPPSFSQFAVQALFPPGPLAARPTKGPLKSRVILHFSASHARQRIRAL